MWAEITSEVLGNEAHPSAIAGPALDLVVAELDPMAASLLAIGPDGAVRCEAARAPKVLGDAHREVANWHRQVGPHSPLDVAEIARFDRAVVTFADVGDERSILLEDGSLLGAYRRIGAIDDARVLIRDGRRLVATIAVWRPLQSMPWSADQRRRLEALHPLIEMAWRGAPRPPVREALGPLPEAALTPREREVAELLVRGATNPQVARALGISHNTVKTHARAVLGKLGVGSRRELLLALRETWAAR
jgi:DNA-binding CsgD family transcriptional regulator